MREGWAIGSLLELGRKSAKNRPVGRRLELDGAAAPPGLERSRLSGAAGEGKSALCLGRSSGLLRSCCSAAANAGLCRQRKCS